MDDYEPVLETLRRNPPGTLILWRKHRPDAHGRCPLCHTRDCTLRTLAYEALRTERGTSDEQNPLSRRYVS